MPSIMPFRKRGGVRFYNRVKKWTAHIWVYSTDPFAPRREGQYPGGMEFNKEKNKWQYIRERDDPVELFLGAWNTGEEAARAYDKAALVLIGPDAYTNFNPEEYQEEVAMLSKLKRREVVIEYLSPVKSSLIRGRRLLMRLRNEEARGQVTREEEPGADPDSGEEQSYGEGSGEYPQT